MLVAFLFGLRDNVEQIDVDGFVVLQEVLFCMLDDAVGTKRH